MAKDPTLVSIPGTANPDHMRENAAAAAIALSADMVARVDAAVNARTVTGSRYPSFMQATVVTERTPAEADA
jgi:hypothetical protein